MRKTIIAVLSGLLMQNCQNKQIYQKTSLPRNESFIIVSGKADPENYNEKMEIYLVSPSGGQISVWDSAEESSPSSDYSFNYREYLVYENEKEQDSETRTAVWSILQIQLLIICL